MPSRSQDSGFMVEVRRRFADAREGWERVRETYRRNMRMVFGDQWEPDIRSAREQAKRPVLSFPVLHTFVGQVTNQARRDRSESQVQALGQGASMAVAHVYEGIFRHIQQVSQAQVAYDTSVECAAGGGFGFYEFTTAYVDDQSFDQEPRIVRVADPLTVYFDPMAQEADFSDAKYYFKREPITKAEYKRRFGTTPPTDFEDDVHRKDWSGLTEEMVWIAEYVYVTIKRTKKYRMKDGSDFEGDLAEGQEYQNYRWVEERSIDRCIVDGSRVLEETPWVGKWLPMIPVLGREVIVDGERKFLSVTHFANDAQKLKNACGSGMAESVANTSRTPVWAAKGSVNDPSWTDWTRTWAIQQYEAYNENGQPLPPPTRNVVEPPIAAFQAGMLMCDDNIRRAVGYQDTIINASQADLSGIAIDKRDTQASLANMHFGDNLKRSQWHGGRVMLDLIKKTLDTPRVIRMLAADGTVTMQAVTMAIDGEVPQIAPFDGREPIQIHVGEYDVALSTGKSYTSQLESQADILLQAFRLAPELWPTFSDILFESLGYQQLAERAKLTLPPAIQNALAAKEQGLDSKAQAMLMQMAQQLQLKDQQMQQLVQGIEKLLFERQAKIVETQGKLAVTELQNESKEKIAGAKNETDVTVSEIKHGHEAAARVFEANNEFEKQARELIAKIKTAPDPDLSNFATLAKAAQPKPTGRPN